MKDTLKTINPNVVQRYSTTVITSYIESKQETLEQINRRIEKRVHILQEQKLKAEQDIMIYKKELANRGTSYEAEIELNKKRPSTKQLFNDFHSTH